MWQKKAPLYVIFIRLQSRLQPNIGFTLGLRRVWRCHTFGSVESEPILMKSGVHCRELAFADFGRDSCSSDSCNARRFPVGQILRNNTSIGVKMKTFGTEF